MSGGTYHLIRDVPHTIPEGSLISLHPQVSQFLHQCNIPYHILQDYFSEKEIRSFEEGHFENQITWCNTMDQMVNNEIAPMQAQGAFRPFFHHLSKWKYLFDIFVLWETHLDYFITRTKPNKILYYEASSYPASNYSLYSLRENTTPFWKDVLISACQRHHIECTIISVSKTNPPPFQPASKVYFQSIHVVAKTILHFFKFHKFFHFVVSRSKSSVLFLDIGDYAMDNLVRQLMSLPIRIFYMSQGMIRELTHYLEQRSYYQSSNKNTISPLFQKRLDSFFQKMLRNENWVIPAVPKSFLHLSKIFILFLEEFLTKEMPRTLQDFISMRDFLIHSKVKAVIAKASSGRPYCVALNAAASLGIPRSCIQHACGPVAMSDWIFSDLAYFDHLGTMDALTKNAFSRFYENHSALFTNKPVITESISSLHNIAKCPNQSRRKYRRILIVPMKSFEGLLKLNSFLYPITTHFELLKNLISACRHHPEIEFLIKHPGGITWLDDSIGPLLKMIPNSNIQMVKGKLRSYFSKIDACFCDFPSTPFFESLAAGIPTCSVYPSAAHLFPEMKEFFGPCLLSFDHLEEIPVHFNYFIKEDPALFRRTLPFGQDSSKSIISKFLNHDIISDDSSLITNSFFKNNP